MNPRLGVGGPRGGRAGASRPRRGSVPGSSLLGARGPAGREGARVARRAPGALGRGGKDEGWPPTCARPALRPREDVGTGDSVAAQGASAPPPTAHPGGPRRRPCALAGAHRPPHLTLTHTPLTGPPHPDTHTAFRRRPTGPTSHTPRRHRPQAHVPHVRTRATHQSTHTHPQTHARATVTWPPDATVDHHTLPHAHGRGPRTHAARALAAHVGQAHTASPLAHAQSQQVAPGALAPHGPPPSQRQNLDGDHGGQGVPS